MNTTKLEAPGINPAELGAALVEWLAEQGFQAALLMARDGGVAVQARRRQKNLFRIDGLSRSMTVVLYRHERYLVVTTGNADWAANERTLPGTLVFTWEQEAAAPRHDPLPFIRDYIQASQAVALCHQCGHPIPAGARYCGICNAPVQAAPEPVPAAKTILFLAAEPTNTAQLRLGEELREIDEKLRMAKLRDQFRLAQRLSARPADISQAFLDLTPEIVHFSGHGMQSGALCFENQAGGLHPIGPEALAALFAQFTGQIRCVVLNACYSEKQAQAIAQHVPCVVGMGTAIGDRAAIAFAIGFYQALGAGRPFEAAYGLGCVQIGLHGIGEDLTPVLIQHGAS